MSRVGTVFDGATRLSATSLGERTSCAPDRPSKATASMGAGEPVRNWFSAVPNVVRRSPAGGVLLKRSGAVPAVEFYL